MNYVCPACLRPLRQQSSSYECKPCGRTYPVICGIADFRLAPDPYIGIEEDRAKGKYLDQAAEGRSFKELLEHYYAITPDDPADLAVHWIAHSLAEVEIARDFLQHVPHSGRLLDVGCSTGGLLAAAHGRASQVVGVDVAFRWLVVGKARLRELGVAADLVCANAEALPFPPSSFATVTLCDTAEHVRSLPGAVHEAARVLTAGGCFAGATNNRYAPLPDPQVRMWGVGWLPRRMQHGYVAWRRPDLHRYNVQMVGASELWGLLNEPRWSRLQVEPALLTAPHLTSAAMHKAVRLYNNTRLWPVMKGLLTWGGPRLAFQADRSGVPSAHATDGRLRWIEPTGRADS